MNERKPVISAHGGGPAAPEKAAAWRRVTRILALSVALVGGAALYRDGGLTASNSIAGGLCLAVLAYLVMGAVGSGRGLRGITAANDRRNRFRVALGLGLFCALVGGGGVYFHDGSPLDTALLSAAGLGFVGFAAAYFPVVPFLASIFSLFR